jgi:FkbM family methyltransferase
MTHLLNDLKNLKHELSAGFQALADRRSRLIWARDLLLYHAIVAGAKKPRESIRTVKFKNGAVIKYSLNEGDIQSVREVMIDQIYRVPESLLPSVMVDLGANIGLASIFYHFKYGCDVLMCVEPLKRNVKKLRENLAINGIDAIVHEAAISSVAGTLRFKEYLSSNVGHVDQNGDLLVNCITMDEILRDTPNNRIDVLKIDIEGHEQTFLSQNNSWLNRIGAILIEFHPEVVDYGGSVEILRANGFRYYPPAYTNEPDAWQGPTDLFVRESGASLTCTPSLVRG